MPARIRTRWQAAGDAVVIARTSVKVGFANANPSETHDDRRDDEPAQPGGEDPGRRPPAEMIGFAAERLMELEVGGLTGAAGARRAPSGWSSATATGTGFGRRGREPLQLRIPKLRKGSYFRASWSRGGCPRRR